MTYDLFITVLKHGCKSIKRPIPSSNQQEHFFHTFFQYFEFDWLSLNDIILLFPFFSIGLIALVGELAPAAFHIDVLNSNQTTISSSSFLVSRTIEFSVGLHYQHYVLRLYFLNYLLPVFVAVFFFSLSLYQFLLFLLTQV